jgi:hypothetical protein
MGTAVCCAETKRENEKKMILSDEEAKADLSKLLVMQKKRRKQDRSGKHSGKAYQRFLSHFEERDDNSSLVDRFCESKPSNQNRARPHSYSESESNTPENLTMVKAKSETKRLKPGLQLSAVNSVDKISKKQIPQMPIIIE